MGTPIALRAFTGFRMTRLPAILFGTVVTGGVHECPSGLSVQKRCTGFLQWSITVLMGKGSRSPAMALSRTAFFSFPSM
jgi:hypothetical protein